jgi:aquaporin Z
MNSMVQRLTQHWPQYLMEASELGAFMISASLVTSLLYHPSSPLSRVVTDPLVRRLVTGLLMGSTAIALVHSPWGRQSGAHMNPSLTLTFLRLGKVAPWDALFYVTAQFAGGVGGLVVASLLIGSAITSPEVNYVATLPGSPGAFVAFVAEFMISFVLMLTVLATSNTVRLARLTPYLVGTLVAAYITLESPLSGMSMNPARTFGPALVGHAWRSLWVYFTAPPLGMLLAAEVYLRVKGRGAVWCAKLLHPHGQYCIFNCAYPMSAGDALVSAGDRRI